MKSALPSSASFASKKTVLACSVSTHDARLPSILNAPGELTIAWSWKGRVILKRTALQSPPTRPQILNQHLIRPIGVSVRSIAHSR